MLQPVIQALTKKCVDEKTNVSYYAEYVINSPKLHVFVDGVGKLDFPINQDTIHNLLQASEQAQFGWRDQTLTDTNIRDTQEISARYLQVELENDFLASMLDEVKQQLGLSDNVKLNAHLHNLLIYGAEQFFKPHRDSEKLDGMVATLVIVLPAPHIGGDLLIHHNKEQHRFISENLNQTGLKCIAFYADCYHEVERIKQGYRVALTYNIVLQTTSTEDKGLENTALDMALKNYFGLPETNNVDNNLIYYLDHSYTEHSLRWDLLKGNDYHYSRAFLNAAKKLDLLPHLALVEIHESWTTEDEDYNPTPDELIDNSTSLNFWIDEHNQPITYHYPRVDEEEVCWSTPTDDLEPDETEHEGYMGNYGNTVDYWYRRAAVVLWPKQAQIRMNFRLNHDEAMCNVFQLTQKNGNESKVLNVIKQADHYFHQSGHPSKTQQQPFEQYIQLALYIKDKATSLFVLSNHPLYALNATHTELLLALQKQYDVEWCLSLLEQWKTKAMSRYNDDTLIQDLNGLITAFIFADIDINIMNFLVDYQLQTLMQYNERNKHARPVDLKESLHSRLEILQDTFSACVALSDSRFTQQLIQYLISNTRLYPPTELAPLLISWQRVINFQSMPWYQSLFSHVETAVQQEVSKGLRSEQDKSIELCLPCKCAYCKNVNVFLQSATETTKVVAIKEDIRRHIMSSFSGLGLPVSLSEVRTGSPYKLVIKKDDNLYQVSKERFDGVSIYQRELGLASNEVF